MTIKINSADGTIKAGSAGDQNVVLTNDGRLPPTPSGSGKTLYDNGGGAYIALAAGTSTQVLKGGTTPSWGSVTSSFEDSSVEITSHKGAASGYASLDTNTKIPYAQIPTGTTSSTICAGDDSRLSGSRTSLILGSFSDPPDTLSNTTVQTAFSTTITIPANTFQVGTVLEFYISGNLSTGGFFNGNGATWGAGFILGAVGTLTALGTTNSIASYQCSWVIQGSCTCITSGATGTVQYYVEYRDSNDTIKVKQTTSALLDFDTTATKYVGGSFQTGTAT